MYFESALGNLPGGFTASESAADDGDLRHLDILPLGKYISHLTQCHVERSEASRISAIKTLTVLARDVSVALLRESRLGISVINVQTLIFCSR